MTNKPVCAIIGAGEGVSLGVARRFAHEGHRLVLFSRSKPQGLADRLAAEGHDVSSAALEAGDLDGIRQALAALGPVDALLYNAAAVTTATPSSLSPDALIADFKVSVAGALAAAQAVLPGMMTAGHGTILLTGGGFALRPMAAMASLGVGKAGLRNLAVSLFEELQPKGVRVGTVTIMGFVKPGTPFDPDSIAEAFWRLHQDRDGAHGPELMFDGKG